MPFYPPTAPVDASYAVIAANSNLTAERVVTNTSNISFTDGGTTVSADLSSTGVSPATYGGLNRYVTLAIDAKGRVTTATDGAIAFPASLAYGVIAGTSGSATAGSGADTLSIASGNGVTAVAANGSPDTLTISTPQDVRTSASPTFVNATLSGRSSGNVAYFTAGGAFTDSTNFTFDGSKVSLPVSGSSGGISVGSDVVLYRTTTDTWRTDDKFIFAPPSNTATSGSFIGTQVQANSSPASSSSARNWGLQFAVAHNTAQNLTDPTSGITGIEGYARNESTGTVTREVGGLFYTDCTAAGNVTNALGLWVFNSVTHASAITSEFSGLRVSGGTNTGTQTAWYGTRVGAPAFSANSQTRIAHRVEAMPDPGAFTGTTCFAINIEGTSRATRDGIRIGGDTILYSSAANRLALDSGDSFELNAGNLLTDTTTGTKIGTATTQKWGFWNATPIVQPTTAVAAATFVANTSAIANDTATFDGYTIGQVVKALRNIGLLA